MKTKLTDRLIRTRKPPATGRLIITDTVVSGLSIRINPASTKNPDGLRYWLFRYRPRGQAQRSSVLGPYPALGLADARRRAGDISNAGPPRASTFSPRSGAKPRSGARPRPVHAPCGTWVRTISSM